MVGIGSCHRRLFIEHLVDPYFWYDRSRHSYLRGLCSLRFRESVLRQHQIANASMDCKNDRRSSRDHCGNYHILSMGFSMEPIREHRS